MDKNLQQKINEYLKQHGLKQRWQKVVTVLAAVVLFGTVYALMMPAATLEGETFCGMEEHTHTDDCYESVLVCTLTEEGHTHSDECGTEEVRELTCGLEETDGHTHTDACYADGEPVLSCGLEENAGHSHGEGCYDEEGNLICGKDESTGHSHDGSCYTIPRELVCTETECAAHTHDDSCYTVKTIYLCGLEECEPHEHTDACYAEELACELEEHVHTLQCFSNPDADLETAAGWEQAFENVELTGNWAEDVLTIAETQLGYTESTKNYKVLEDGETMKGYTRYGQWKYDPYGDWCAMFCSFCMNYAEINDEVIPFDGNCQHWIDTLSGEEFELYHTADSDYIPKPGDLIFFNHDEDEDADHVGFVYELIEATEEEPAQIRTLEGNHRDSAAKVDCVNYVKYDLDDETILGYGEMPEKP